MDTATKIRAFHGLLHKNGMMQSKHDILAGYGVESTKELNDAQLDELIVRLRDMLQNRTKQTTSPQVRQWRSNVLTMLTRYGIDTTDWQRINAFLLDNRIAGKLLYELDLDELKTLHRKLIKVVDKREKERLKQLHNPSVN